MPAKTSTFDDGPSRSRRRQLFDVVRLKVAIELKFATLPTFRAFTKDTLNQGARRFTGPVLLPDGTVGTRTCKIEGPVALTYLGRTTPVVTFLLSVWDWQQ